MSHLIREALRRATRQDPAIPFATLVTRLRAEGAAVTEGVLARSLEAPGSGARLLDPWCGPHSALRGLVTGDGASQGPWVVVDGSGDEDPEPDPPGPAAVRRSILRLGRDLDARSARDLARWMALVAEARALPRAA